MRNKSLRLSTYAIALLVLLPATAPAQQRCGGTERWAVKVGTDPAAREVDLRNPIPITIQQLNALPDPRNGIGKDTPRTDAEKRVYQVSGILRLFKFESDKDYHLVITDASLRYSKGGKASKGKETGTSFIAEIADPKCYMGQKGDLNHRSHWEQSLRQAREQFEARFDRDEQDEEMQVPVTIIGVAFFDRDHGQVGRARNGFELHPVLSITFGEPATVAAAPASSGPERNLLINSGFEEGPRGWTASSGVIESDGYPDASRGNAKATVGDLGVAGSTFLSQQVTIPANVASST